MGTKKFELNICLEHHYMAGKKDGFNTAKLILFYITHCNEDQKNFKEIILLFAASKKRL
jgi:hypothetical protein